MRERRLGETMKIIRIVLLIADGLYLLVVVDGIVAFLQRGDVMSLLLAIPLAVFGSVSAGNISYILRCLRRTKHASDRQ